MKCFTLRRLLSALCATGLFGISAQTMASSFQLWEQDGATPGYYHAGYAVDPANASIAFYNPAGITLFKDQQISVGGVGILTDFKYKGDVTVHALGTSTQTVTAQGGNFGFVPNLNYIVPINDYLGFGFSVDVPFGLKTDYGYDTYVRYTATTTSITTVDISPSLGLKVTDKASLGVGLDVQKMYGEFDQVGTIVIAGNPMYNTDSINKANDVAYGFHAGTMYQFTPATRAGLSYHSQVVHHLSGTSHFEGPLAESVNSGYPYASRITTNITLPPYTAFSVSHRLLPRVELLGSVIYTQWNVFKDLVINDLSGIEHLNKSTSIQVTTPANYRNTWNFSVGANYFATDQIILRSGVGYDETPVTNAYRNVQLPDNNRFVLGLGGHYQACKAIGLDLSWSHFFINDARITPPPQQTGDQVVTTNGQAQGGADVFGAQISWNIA